MNIFVCVVCAVLMVLGITELIRLLVFWWVRPDTSGAFSVVVIPESAESCEYRIRAAAEKIRWLELKGPCWLICVNREGNPEIDRICRLLSLRYPYLKVSKPEDLLYNVLRTGEDLQE